MRAKESIIRDSFSSSELWRGLREQEGEERACRMERLGLGTVPATTCMPRRGKHFRSAACHRVSSGEGAPCPGEAQGKAAFRSTQFLLRLYSAFQTNKKSCVLKVPLFSLRKCYVLGGGRAVAGDYGANNHPSTLWRHHGFQTLGPSLPASICLALHEK